MSETKKICMNCKHYVEDSFANGGICDIDTNEFVILWVNPSDSCNKFEPRDDD